MKIKLKNLVAIATLTAALSACEKEDFQVYPDVPLTIISADAATEMIVVQVNGNTMFDTIPPYQTVDFEDFLEVYAEAGPGMPGIGIRPDTGPDAGKLFLGTY